jgi:signal transduction histidine kinase
VFVYGVAMVAAIRFHQIFLQELWHTLSDRYRVDFAIVEGIVLIALVLWVKPLRQRSAEALQYLLGSRVDRLRRNTRQFALQMSAQIDKPLPAIVDWFCREGLQALDAGTVAVWLFAADGRIELAGGEVRDFTTEDIIGLHQLMKSRGHTWCTPLDAPVATLQDKLQQLDVALAVVIEHPGISGLVMFGSASREVPEEQLNALLMVIEQLAVTLSNSLLQARRIDAERRAHQNEKLSTLGLIASSMAHEVKNPLASIRTITTVMAEDLGPDSDYTEDLRLIIGEVDRLNTTIGHLLRFARPAAGSAANTGLADVIAGILHIMRHLSLQSAVALDNRLPPALPAVKAQENALREIFFNLLVNAIEAAAAAATAGQVTVSGYQQDNDVVIEVLDNGPGIAQELLPHIFEPFVSAKASGTGLGLYLVERHIVDIGGTIECCSDPVGGTRFRVRLPLAANDEKTPCR